MKAKKLTATLLAAATAMSFMTAGAYAEETETAAAPKYVFLFIGDGMSYPQIQLTNYFVSANANEENPVTVTAEGEEKAVLKSQNNLTMMNFPVAGSAQTYDSTSFAQIGRAHV